MVAVPIEMDESVFPKKAVMSGVAYVSSLNRLYVLIRYKGVKKLHAFDPTNLPLLKLLETLDNVVPLERQHFFFCF